jgi:hypothetical protein
MIWKSQLAVFNEHVFYRLALQKVRKTLIHEARLGGGKHMQKN